MRQTLDIARRLFAQRGYAAVTMEDVAGEVGVTKPLLYNYFGNKEQLYIACMESSGDAMVAALAEAVVAAADPADALAAGLSAFLRFIDEDRAAWGVLFDETSLHIAAVARRVAEYRGRIAEMVAGSLLVQLPERRRAAARIEVEALSAALLGAAEALARWWLRSGEISAEEAAELVVSTVQPGLRLRSQGPGRASADAVGAAAASESESRRSAPLARTGAGEHRAVRERRKARRQSS